MVRIWAVFFLVTISALASSASAASAQPAAPPQENTTVTAAQLHEMVDKFAKAFATPTKLTGKIARWESGICPVAVGQSPQSISFITTRLKAIAAAAGAPVSGQASCTPNIEIVFTSAPQDLLDNIRKNDSDYLGYAESSSERDRLATVTHPIQAWYETETVDLRGMRRVDLASRLDATFARSTGTHITGGAHSAFHHIIIAADTQKLSGQNFAALADYIALLALAQLNSLDACQPLPSVVNMTAPGCDHRVDGMTQYDLAYLRGLYQMAADKSLIFQQNDITDRMQQALMKDPSANSH